MDEKIEYWVDIAEYDMVTAEVMLESKRYLYVGFMCHQIVEKILKAYYIKKHERTPPFTHNLNSLVESCDLINELDEEILLYLFELQPLNIEARYPTYKDKILKLLTNEKCKELLAKTKEFQEWIKMKL